MRLHGLVTLSLLAGTSGLAQDLVPRPIDTPDQTPVPSLLPTPLGSAAPPATDLQQEIDLLKEDLEKFRAERDEVRRTLRTVDSESNQVLIRQRQEMLNLVTRLATQAITRPKTPVEPPPVPDAKIPEPPVPPVLPDVTDAAVDMFSLGKSLFRSGDYAKAEQAFRKVPVTADNRLLLKYLVATCQRKQSQWQAALDGYREVAASNQDPVLRDLARFQMDGIQWNLDTEKQLEQLKRQRSRPATGTP